MEFMKVITVGTYTVGVVYEDDMYVVVDNFKGQLSKFERYVDAIEEMQIHVCDKLNDYFEDVYEDKLVS